MCPAPRFWSSNKFSTPGSLRIRSCPSRSDGNDRRGGRRRSRDDARGELFRGQIAQRAVRAHGVVISPPVLDHLPCVPEIHEPVLVQAFIAELSVEALDQRVLRGLAALDAVQCPLVLISPLLHDAAGELGSVVDLDRPWCSTSLSQPLQYSHHAQTW